MTSSRDSKAQEALDRLLTINGLSGDALLYREVVREVLEPTEAADVYRLRANPRSNDTVEDIYGKGHVVQAEDLGPGLTFAMTWAHSWQQTMEMRVAFGASGVPVDRVGVKVRVADLLAQGGLIYPVHSVSGERAWYCTLPTGSIEVREVR